MASFWTRGILLALALTFPSAFTVAATDGNQTFNANGGVTTGGSTTVTGPLATPNIAFYYGAQAPVGMLQAFDAVVLDPRNAFDPGTRPLPHTTWIARVSPNSSAASGADAAALIQNVLQPLWQRGFRGFMLDDTVGGDVIARVHAQYPDAKLMVAGDEAVTRAAGYAASLYAVVGPSLILEVDRGGALVPVSDDARAQRLAASRAFTAKTGVPVIDVEFCDGPDRDCARRVAKQVVGTGGSPYVTDRAFDVVGMGRIEVMPRKVLVVQDRNTNEALDLAVRVHNIAAPLNYLGYEAEYADLDKPFPENVNPDRYAGIVVWIDDENVPNVQAWREWIGGRIDAHVPIAFLGRFGFNLNDGAGQALGLRSVQGPFTAPVNVVHSDPLVGFEIQPNVDPRDIQGVRITDPQGQSLLRLNVNGQQVDEIGMMPWGGYALAPYKVVSLNGIELQRWAINPLSFLTRALRLPTLPSPSLTTENGLRLLMTHVDGDGFASRAEFPGPDYSGQALYDRIFTRYKIPMLLSVIEGEVGPTGLYPKISPRLEQIAKAMFALPNVQIGSHTYSHPFQWDEVDAETGAKTDAGGGDAAFSLNIPNYTFNLDREIGGSIDYINTRLAPPGKKVEVLQWSGDCHPPALAIRKVYEAGVYNFNGGDTVITKSANSWTNISPVGVDKGPGAYQVYAPNQDENVYTNDWQGPFYGFSRVLETFAMTDAPLRFKPIDIYYHMYTGTKEASLHSLEQIFDAVLKQPVLPVYVTEYIQKVLDWRSFAVSRDVQADATGQAAWRFRGNGAVREVHWQPGGAPDLRHAYNVTGYAPGPDGIYIHIEDGDARVAINPNASARPTQPYISFARGFVKDAVVRPDGMRFSFAGHYEPYIRFENAGQCSVTVNGQRRDARREAGTDGVAGSALRIDLPAQLPEKMQYDQVDLHCGR
ncbi:sugar ABC transporter [Robbsia andropogonis]|uniref:sugar ABC transporter n=1 Tax=Robbsia andropogonis TaxID=28092 RepID=UPI00209EE14B|nr:sugar ABC transporter [Robbsia andropogonis]MCP1119900.1 sugar ABC transporter [Robbsia andropogonis]MCP1129770.1 sugar ABC transporter [Robbsia andropogonis]